MFKRFTEWVQNKWTNGIHGKAMDEMRASGLQGGADGPADAYRHILRAAEMKRQGLSGTELYLDFREGPWSSTDSAMDHHNNRVGYAIGEYVRKQGGTWDDVKRLARAAVDGVLKDTDMARIEEGNGFTKDPSGFLTRGKLTLADGLTIDSPAIFPSARWYEAPQIAPVPGPEREKGQAAPSGWIEPEAPKVPPAPAPEKESIKR